MNAERAAVITRMHSALTALELTGVRRRADLRRHLHVGDEELTALLHLAHHGSVAQRRLGELTGLSRSGAGAMIQRLEEQGYVRRWTDEHDRRLRWIELSPAGRDALDAGSLAWRTTIADALDDTATDDVVALVDVLDRLVGDPAGDDGGHDAGDGANSDAAPIWRHWA